MKPRTTSFFLLSALLLFLPVIVGADDADVWFRGVITRLLNIVIWPVFIGAAIVMFIFAGIMFFAAMGDPNKISSANKAVLWIVFGIIVGLLGFIAVGIIRTILGM